MCGCDASDVPKLSYGLAELVRDWVINSVDAVFYWCVIQSLSGQNPGNSFRQVFGQCRPGSKCTCSGMFFVR